MINTVPGSAVKGEVNFAYVWLISVVARWRPAVWLGLGVIGGAKPFSNVTSNLQPRRKSAGPTVAR